MPVTDIDVLKEKIKTGKIRSWDVVHEFIHRTG
jgi:hypothetical protein